MLRSTGFFRGLDCPFYAEPSEAQGGRSGCSRPYCHFRHSRAQRRPSHGATQDATKQHKEPGYDPFNPEVVVLRPGEEQQNGGGDLSGALELVNRAIEEVQGEVEKERRKLSRIGDEPYDPGDDGGGAKTASVHGGKNNKPSRASRLAYDPTENNGRSASSVRGKSKTQTSPPQMAYEPSERNSSGALKSKASNPSHMAYDPSDSAFVSRSTAAAAKGKLGNSEMAYEPTEKNSASSSPSSSAVKTKTPPSSHTAYDPTDSAFVSKSAAAKSKSELSEMSYNPTGKNSVSSTAKNRTPPSSSSHMAYDPSDSAFVSSSAALRSRSDPSPMAYEPSESSVASPSASVKSKHANSSHMAYDPGSYQITSADYNPTPGCSKYTLDPDSQGNSYSNSMEYVPTSVKKHNPSSRTQTQTHQLPSSPPPSPKYSTGTTSSFNNKSTKYTLDNSRPSTDMEYDPLSNYTAGIAVKSKRDKCAKAAKILRVHGSTTSDEEYTVAAKKPRQPSVDTQKYTISDSGDESSGTEYRPATLSSLQQKKSNSEALWDAVIKEKLTLGLPNALTQRNKEDSGQAGHSDVPDNAKRKDRAVEKKKGASGHDRSGKPEKAHKPEKEASKKTAGKSVGCGGSSNSKDKSLVKSSSQDSAKKENKSHGKKPDGKPAVKVSKTSERVRDEKRSDGGKARALEKVKTDSNKREKDAENGLKETKKPKLSDKDKEVNKHRDKQHKNGQLDGGRGGEKDVKKSSKSSSSVSNTGKGTSANSKEKSKQNTASPSSAKRREEKRRSQSLTHVDLFGDESPDEHTMEALEVDDSEEETDEVLVRKSADALKRRRVNKRKASELTPSSSDDDEEDDEDVIRAKEQLDMVQIDLTGFHDDLDLDSDPMEECLRIFNESKDVKREDKGRQAKQASRDSDEERGSEPAASLVPGQKRRVSHCPTARGTAEESSRPAPAPYRRLSAQEVCYRRMQLAQQQANQLSASVKQAASSRKPPAPPPASSSSSSSSGERKRIAHRPTAPTASKTSSVRPSSRVLSPSPSHPTVKVQTTAGILSKTVSTSVQKRVAHTPTLKSSALKRPVIPTEFGAKVPNNVRQRYLHTFIDECVKFCPSEELAFQMALDEEKQVYDRSSSKNIYLNVAVNTLKKLRNKSTSAASPAHSKHPAVVNSRRAMSHEEVLGGKLAATTSFTVNRMGKQQEEKPTGAALYRKLQAYQLTEEQLQEHGYPRPNPESSGRALLYNQPEKKPASSDPLNKVCCRCGAEYKINVNGNCVRKEECTFHWGRLRRHKVSGGWETSYSCCSAAVGSQGCSVAKQHVQDGRKESLDGYVTTFSKDLPPDGNGGVFALDCEMCYTKVGLELTRVTVIDSELKVIYDTFVKPQGKVVDYNTRFSGVTAEDLEHTSISLRDVQAVLLSMFSAQSVLIGHSLESDLLALKLIHSTVVDTAVVFPHRIGLPYKRALRNLMADHLKRIIQDNVDGHDSSEDASACMELMFWRIKEDAKVKR